MRPIGIGYSLAMVIPSFAGIYVLWLSHVMPYLFAPIVWLISAAGLMIVGVLLGPRRRARSSCICPASAIALNGTC